MPSLVVVGETFVKMAKEWYQDIFWPRQVTLCWILTSTYKYHTLTCSSWGLREVHHVKVENVRPRPLGVYNVREYRRVDGPPVTCAGTSLWPSCNFW